MLTFYEAREQILAAVPLLPIEETALLDAAGRAVAEAVIASQPLPAFDNSAMDGYAVRTADCSYGIQLPVKGYLPAGSDTDIRIEPGSAIKIMTGAPVPAGSDAVVPFEETVELPDQIRLLGKVKAGDHIRRRGEDIRPGDQVIAAGTVLRPAEISLLASFGMTSVRVHRQVRAAILATGDELQEIDEQRCAGGVINSNSWALASAVKEIGGVPIILGIARDNRESLRTKLKEGLQADVLITSAGVSAGECDLVREVLDELGVRQQFWKINIKPGKPTAFGMKKDVPVFSLPGNPVSTMITFEEFVRPALLKMMGHRIVIKPLFRAQLQVPYKKKAGRLQLMRVSLRLNDEGLLLAASPGDQNTGILSTMINAQGIAILDAERDRYAAGDQILVHLLGTATELGY